MKGTTFNNTKDVIDYNNKNRKDAATLAFERRLKGMGVNDAYIRERMALGDEYKKSFVKFKNSEDAGEQNKILDTFINKQFDEGAGNKNNPAYVTNQGNVFREGRMVKVPKEIGDKYTVNVGTTEAPEWEKPTSFYMSKDKKYVIPMYGKKDDNGTWRLDGNKGQPISIQNYKLDLSKLLLTKKQTGAEVTDQFTGDEDPSSYQSIETSTEERTPSKTSRWKKYEKN